MKWHANTHDVTKALKTVAPIVSKWDGHSIRLKTVGNDGLRIASTDHTKWLALTIPAEVKKPGDATLHHGVLTKLMGTWGATTLDCWMDGNDVRLTFSDEGSVTIPQQQREFPVFPEPEKGLKFIPLPRYEFLACMKKAAAAYDRTKALDVDTARVYMARNMMHVTHVGRTVAANWTFPIGNRSEAEAMVPLLAPWANLLPDEENPQIAFGEKLWLRTDASEAAISKLTTTLPDIRKLDDQTRKQRVSVPVLPLLNAVTRCEIVSTSLSKRFTAAVRQGAIEVSTVAEEGTVEERLEADTDGGTVDIQMNAVQLARLLRSFPEDGRVTMWMGSHTAVKMVVQDLQNCVGTCYAQPFYAT